MPQLDPNTFFYQYLGIITVLILVYTTLSYIVLPMLLRLMLVRSLFVIAQQRLTEALTITPAIYQPVITFKKRIYSIKIVDKILKSSTNRVKNFLHLITNNLFWPQQVQNYKASKTLFNLSDSVNDYLILFLLIELEEVNE